MQINDKCSIMTKYGQKLQEMTRLYSKENIKFKHNIKYIPWVDQLAVFPEENQEQDVVQDNI